MANDTDDAAREAVQRAIDASVFAALPPALRDRLLADALSLDLPAGAHDL
jgi:hypothetical protein